MQLGKGAALDKMAGHLNAHTRGQEEEGTLGGILRLSRRRQRCTNAGPGGRAGKPGGAWAPAPSKRQAPSSWWVSPGLASVSCGKGEAPRAPGWPPPLPGFLCSGAIISAGFAGHCPGRHMAPAQTDELVVLSVPHSLLLKVLNVSPQGKPKSLSPRILFLGSV